MEYNGQSMGSHELLMPSQGIVPGPVQVWIEVLVGDQFSREHSILELLRKAKLHCSHWEWLLLMVGCGKWKVSIAIQTERR